jgi:hypothetical protein
MFEIPGRADSFPCEFPMKVIGREADDFEGFVKETVSRFVPEPDLRTVSRRLSRTGKYVSVTVTFMAESQEQLDELYFEFSQNRRVLFLL